VGPALFNPREDIVEANRLAVRIHIDHRAVDLKQGDHFLHVRIDDERMGLAGGLIGIGAFGGDPIMLQIAPFPLQDEGVDRLGMAMA
jgi:hypothetical protein